MRTLDQLSDAGTTWCFYASQIPTFDKRFFDTDWLTQHGHIDGVPTGGRGNTCFFNIDGNELVLREYRRGGLVRHVSKRHYVWSGMPNTRAFQEMHILDRCGHKQLPTPKAYACRITRHGVFYTASLITFKVKGHTLADTLSQGVIESDAWLNAGRAIADMHNANIWHADLNAHNILLDDANAISLIDFDRAREIPLSGKLAQGNIQRLHRSLMKGAEKQQYEFDSTGWQTLLNTYQAHRVAA